MIGVLVGFLVVIPQGIGRADEYVPEVERVMVKVRSSSGDPFDETVKFASDRISRVSVNAPREYRVQGSLRRARDQRRWLIIEVSGDRVSQVIASLNQDPNVEEAYIEKVYHEAVIPSDVRFSQQWGLNNPTTPLADINAAAAWDRTTGKSDTVIAIVDGGVDVTHEDLQGKIWINSNEVPNNGLDDDSNGFVDDINGWNFFSNRSRVDPADHATHVAGIAAASTNNGLGIAGVDWNAKIMTVQALNRYGVGSEETIIRGINYAVDNGADIINMSLVGPRSEAILDAVEHAYASGVVVVAAAGNSGIDTSRYAVYPACAERNGVDFVLGVAATTAKAEPARFSNYGVCIDIAAPGDDILSLKEGDRYGEMTGTSMSSPFVAGTAGLYKAINPSASVDQIITALSSGEPFIGDKAEEWNRDYKGRLNAAAVVGVLVPEVVPSPSPSLSPSPSPSPVQSPSPSPVPSPAASPSPTPSSGSSSGESSSGGGGGSGAGGGGESEQPQEVVAQIKAKPRVAGIQTKKPNLTLVPRINAAFRSVFGRNPIVIEHQYWYKRVMRADKQSFTALAGAMAWQKNRGRAYIPSS